MTILLQKQLARGQRLEDYTLLERIGTGGQVGVWLAWDEAHVRKAPFQLGTSTHLVPPSAQRSSANQALQ